MTFRDLLLTMRHYLKWVVIVPVLCALIAGGFVLVKNSDGESYTAVSSLTVTDPTGTLSKDNLSNLTDALANGEAASLPGGGVSVKADSVTQSVTFAAQGETAQDAIDLANEAASETAAALKAVLAEQGDAYWSKVNATSDSYSSDPFLLSILGTAAADRVAALQSCVFTITEAAGASGGVSGGLAKYALVGLLGGLFSVVCVLVLMDSACRPIKSADDLQEISDLPVLASGTGAAAAERLWANVQFAVGDDIASICLVPVSDQNEQKEFSSQLARSASEKHSKSKAVSAQQIADGPSLEQVAPVLVVLCDPLDDSVTGAYVANKANATVVLVRCWADRASTVTATLHELRLVKANVVGLALV